MSGTDDTKGFAMADNDGIWVKDGAIVPGDADGAVLHFPAAEWIPPDPKAPLHSIRLVATDSSPFSADIFIDGQRPETVESAKIEVGCDHANRVTIVFSPESIEIEGQFEGWAAVASGAPTPADA